MDDASSAQTKRPTPPSEQAQSPFKSVIEKFTGQAFTELNQVAPWLN